MYIEKNNTLQIINDREAEEKRELPAGTQALLWRREADGEGLSAQLKAEKEKVRRVEIIRARETWQQAGACYVRIQAAAERQEFSLEDIFDEHDTAKSKYILILADNFPIADGRIYKLDKDHVKLDQIDVLQERRGIGYGRLVIREAERWAIELGYKHIVLKSSRSKIGFYERLGYVADPNETDTDEFVLMEKDLTKLRKKKKKRAGTNEKEL